MIHVHEKTKAQELQECTRLPPAASKKLPSGLLSSPSFFDVVVGFQSLLFMLSLPCCLDNLINLVP